MSWLLALSFLIIQSSNVKAAEPEYVSGPICATAQVVEGDSCSNAKVRFDFSKCPGAPEPKVVSSVTCVKSTITARTTAAEARYEAKFKKSDDGWGSVSWAQKGDVKTFIVRAEKPKAIAVAPVPQTAAAREPSQATDAVNQVVQNVKMSAFFDFRFTSYTNENKSASENENNGFLLEDGAVYFNYAKDKLSVLIDLPFRRAAEGSGDTADLAFAETKAQVVARYTLIENLTLVFGQYDTFFGVEVNDSKDRVFGNTGLVYNQSLPIVHDGAYLEYSMSGLMARLMVANASDRGNRGSTPEDSHQEYAASLGYANSFLRTQVGHMTRAMQNLNDNSDTRSLTDIILGGTFGPFDLDLEYSIVRNPQKDTLTPANATDREKDGTAFMALAAFRPIEPLKIGVRYEMIENDPGALGYNRANSIAGNLTYTISNGFMARAEYVDIDSRRKNDGDAWSDRRCDIGAIVTF